MADREEEVRRATEAHEKALRAVQSATPGRPGFGIEAVYGQTYQHLVQLGLKPQLKLKYRAGRQ